jgi:small-conductance mechanosensitive channel
MDDFSTQLNETLQQYWSELIEAIPRIALAIIILALGLLLANTIARFVRRRFLSKAEDPLMGAFLATVIKILLVTGVLLLTLQVAGLSNIAAGLFTAAGASALVLGFAFKDIGENFICGVVLAFSRPFNVNDTIRIDEAFGKIKALQFRYTHVKTFDGRDVYIPNSDVLRKPVVNYTADGFFRHEFTVGIGYENDIDAAKELIERVLREHDEVVHDELHQSFVVEDELAASTVNLKVLFWVDTVDYRRAAIVLRGMLIRLVKERLSAAGFNLPADIRELKLYGTTPQLPIRIENPPADSAQAG